jgi:hypothetical protein
VRQRLPRRLVNRRERRGANQTAGEGPEHDNDSFDLTFERRQRKPAALDRELSQQRNPNRETRMTNK